MSNLVLKKNSPLATQEVKDFYKITFLNGEQRGQSFFIKKGERKVLGRSQTCDVVLKDLKASREHAELIWYKDQLVLSDLKSQNGLIINDKKSVQGIIHDGDKFIVGQSVFKVTLEKIGEVKKPLSKPLPHYDQVEEKPKSMMIIGVLVLVLIFVLFMDGKDKAKVKVEKDENKDGGIDTSILTKIEKKERAQNKALEKEISNYIKLGLRELREKNYFRAKSEFNKALALRPSDPQALFYSRKTNEEINKAVQEFNIDAQRDIESLKYQKAWVSYCGIIRLLHNYPQDKRYKEAKKNLDNIEKTLGYEDGETNCLSK
ncbi:MAG: FHA domain-containing protein [Halobacteriovoraceae bacterium]|nr:FHA domain-containing protein [Halobacteriovoraceae bacterium]